MTRRSGTTSPPRAGAKNSASDAWVTTKVKAQLMAEPGLSPLKVNVDTRDGIVTLFGIVETEQDKAAAEQQATKADGVKSVQNELQVVPDVAANRVEARDDQLQDAVEKRLEERKALKDDDINVEVKNGVVRLTGTVDGFGERMTALTVARSTQGVKSVIDDLRIEEKVAGYAGALAETSNPRRRRGCVPAGGARSRGATNGDSK